jgi:hypothetical protein
VSTFNFDFQGQGNATSYSLGCPATGTIDASCGAVKLVNLTTIPVYQCSICNSTSTAVLTGLTVNSGCINTSSLLTNCQYYSLSTQNCTTCNNGQSPVSVYSAGGVYRLSCPSGVGNIYGCNLIYQNASAVASQNQFFCAKNTSTPCSGSLNFATAGFDNPNTYSALYLGYCTRLTLITNCNITSPVTFNTVGLSCAKCTAGQVPYCTTATANCLAGSLYINQINTYTNATGTGCITSNEIDGCDYYTNYASNTTTGCYNCTAGLTLVKTTASPIGFACTSAPIANCAIYDNQDLTKCTVCNAGYLVNKTNNLCSPFGANNATVQCAAYVIVDNVQICAQCPSGYFLPANSNVCILRVAGCAAYSSSTGCSLCINGYSLLSTGQCKAVPTGCVGLDLNGNCLGCASGYQFDNTNTCVSINGNTNTPTTNTNGNPISNTCNVGQYLSNGICLHGSIPHCNTYSNDGNCFSCNSGYLLNDQYSECYSPAGRFADAVQGCGASPSSDKKWLTVLVPNESGSGVLSQCVLVDLSCTHANSNGCDQCPGYLGPNGRCL